MLSPHLEPWYELPSSLVSHSLVLCGDWSRTSFSQVNNLVGPTANVMSFPTAEEIDICVSYSAMVVYELLLFAFALWAGIRCSRDPSPENRIGIRSLRVVLIQGNVMYFLAWVPLPLAYRPLTDTNSIWLYLIVFLTVSLAAPVSYRLHFRRTTNLTTLVGPVPRYLNKPRMFPACYYWLSDDLAHSKCGIVVAYQHECLAMLFKRKLLSRSLPWSYYFYSYLWWYSIIHTIFHRFLAHTCIVRCMHMFPPNEVNLGEVAESFKNNFQETLFLVLTT